MGNRDIRRSVEGRGMGRGTRGIQDVHHRDFQDFTRQGIFGKEGREFQARELRVAVLDAHLNLNESIRNKIKANLAFG